MADQDASAEPGTPSARSSRVMSTPSVTAMTASGTPRARGRVYGPGDSSPCPGTTKVRVVCRLRPMSDKEHENGAHQAVSVSAKKREVAVDRFVAGGTRRSTCHFHFDDVLEATATQEDVFSTTVQPLLSQVLDGNEATVFAYGQTGTGKTYTMEGELDSETGRGLVPRAAAEVVRVLSEGEYSDYSIAVSYLEIYNEEVSDLISHTRLELKDGGGSRGVSCPGLLEVPVTSLREILEVVRKAQERRRVAGTAVNARSSRSHCIFTMKIKCKHDIVRGDSVATIESTGKLHLVDLAGSEGAKKAAASADDGATLARHATSGNLQQLMETEERERRSINQSLLTLSRVITALRENSCRVPYRDSKLTRLLMDALGGASRTVIIVTISPAAAAVEETISSLSYMENAAGIRNLRSLSSSSLRLFRPTNELRADAGGTGAGNGVSDLVELETRLLLLEHQDAEVREALARKRQECEEETHRADRAEERLVQAQRELRDLHYELIQAQSQCRTREVDADDAASASAAPLLTGGGAAGAEEAVEAQPPGLTRAEALPRLEASPSLSYRAPLRLGTADGGRKASASPKPSPTLNGRNLSPSDGTGAAGSSRSRGVVAAVAGSLKANSAAAAADQVQRMNDVHAEASRLVRRATESQVQIVEGLVAALRKGHRCAEGFWNTKSAEVRHHLEREHLNAVSALDSLEAHAQEALSIIASCDKEVSELVATGEELRKRGDGLCDSLQCGREELAKRACKTVQSLDSARGLGTSLHSNTCMAHGAEVQQLLKAMLESLQSGVGMAQESFCNMLALEKEGKNETSMLNRKALIEAIQEASIQHQEGHAQSVPVVDAMARLSVAIEALGSALPSLQEWRMDLLSAQSGLVSSEEQSCKHVCDHAEALESKFRASLESAQRLLGLLQDTMTRLAADERQKGMVAGIQAKAGQEALEVLREMSFCDETISATRDDVARELDSLIQLRDSEGKIVNFLVEQRQALQDDVRRMQSQLDELKAEVSNCRSRVSGMGTAQRQAQESAKEAILSAVTKELDKLNRSFEDDIADAETNLASVDAIANALRSEASAATERSSYWSESAIREATLVSQGIGVSCESLHETQEKHRLVQSSIKAAASHAHEFEAMESACKDLGAACAKASATVAEAAEAVRGLQEVHRDLAPEWSSMRNHVLEASKKWAQDSRRCRNTLDALLIKHSDVSDRFSDHCDGVVNDHITVAENVKVWVTTSDHHKRTLLDLVTASRDYDEEEERLELAHSDVLVDIIKDASELSAVIKQASTDARSLRDAINQHHAAAARDWEVTVKAITDAAVSSKDVPGVVEAVCSGAKTAFETLSDTNWGLVQELGTRMACCAEASSSSYMAINSESVRCRNALMASNHWFERCWTDAVEAWLSEAQSIKEASDRAEVAVSSTLSPGGEGGFEHLVVDLPRGKRGSALAHPAAAEGEGLPGKRGVPEGMALRLGAVH